MVPTDCGVGYTGNWSVANDGSQTVTGIPTGNTCSVVETAPACITGYTWAAAEYTPATITIDTKGGTFEIVVDNSITRDLGNFKITKHTNNPDGGDPAGRLHGHLRLRRRLHRQLERR